MYAVVLVAGKQYKVSKGSQIKTEKLNIKGKKLNLKEVLLIADDGKVEIGRPFVKSAEVVCKLLGEEKADKAVAFKYRRRKNYKKKTGHRQLLSVLEVKEIKINEATT